MKKLSKVFLFLLLCICTVGIVGCGGTPIINGDPNCKHVWSAGIIKTKATKQSKGTKRYVCELCQGYREESYVLTAPTATETYFARQKVVEEEVEGYNFSFSFGADFSVLGLGTSIEGNYEGKYRNNKTTDNETLYRETSGALLFDSVAYTYTSGDQKIRIDCSEDKKPEKVSVMLNDEDGFFINKSVVEIVDSIQASHINNIKIDSKKTMYDFFATLNFGANTPGLSKFTSLLSKCGTKIPLKNISFVNPAAIPIHFTIDKNGRLDDFELELTLQIQIKLVKTNIFLRYKQASSTTPITIPTIDELSMSSSKILNDVTTINQAINAVKNSNTYSVDATAINEFDPAWNKLATVDKYKARLYKNKVEDNIWFNHSYEYSAHHEEDGAEKYSYTIGNIADGSTYKVSRKGTNITAAIDNVSDVTQFDYLTNPFILDASQIDCILSTTSDKTTVYKVHLKKSAALLVQEKVLDIVNSNNEPGVLDVDNYMNSQISVKRAVFVVAITDGKLESISIETDLKYNPTAGDFVDYNITLTNVLELKINKELSKAQEYVAPEKAEGNIFQTNTLDNAKFYIL